MDCCILLSLSVLFGLKLAHTLFSAAEQVSMALQKKDITLQDALSAVDAARAYYSRLHSDAEFDRFFGAAVTTAQEHKISGPELPKFRRHPSRIEDGSMPHKYPNPRALYRHIYYKACDLLSAELEHRFQNQHIPSVLAIEEILLKAANGSSYQNELSALEVSCYKNDIDWSDLSRHLPLLQDVVKKYNPNLKKVTSVHSICEALNSNNIYKDMLPSVHILLRLYLTIPVTSATSERTFSALRRLLTYLRSTMTEKRLNHCLLLHVHKFYTDAIDLTLVAKEFIHRQDERVKA